MKVNKKTMKIVEMIVFILLGIMSISFIIGLIGAMFQAHKLEMWCMAIGCYCGVLSLACIVIEPA